MQPSRIHHVGLPVSDLDLSVAWYREALGLTHEAAAGVPEGVALGSRSSLTRTGIWWSCLPAAGRTLLRPMSSAPRCGHNGKTTTRERTNP
jgi:catechol 2,3-dioxygenase-like lactoylglutathione lyase family enzyme